MNAPLPPLGHAVLEARSLADLPALLALLRQACASTPAGDAALADLRLASEEVFTNILRHGYGGDSGPVTVQVSSTPEAVRVTLSDQAPDFDPAQRPTPDMDADWQERPIGGLGWHLVYQVMDEVQRQPGAQGGNVYTLVKKR